MKVSLKNRRSLPQNYYLQRFIAFILLLTWPSVVYADTQERRVEEQKRQSLDQLTPELSHEYQRILAEYGGWVNYRYLDFNDSDNDDLLTDSFDSSFLADTRVWMKLTVKPPEDAEYENRHFVYFRLKNLYIQRNGDSSVERYDNNGPHLDYGFAMLDFTPYRIEVGRRYFFAGRGISYSNVNDGVQFNYFRPGWNVGGFVSRTLPHEANIDLSVPGYDKESDRIFYGLGAGYAGIQDQVVYAYGLVQRDDSDERPDDPGQQYTYNSEYLSLGAQGKINTTYNYWMEVIKEFGNSRVFGTNEKTEVDAFGANVGIKRKWLLWWDPELAFEYAFGSGDKDRTSVTDTQGGNLSGNDKNFLYFGYVPTGIAMAPRLSNLHMYRLGATVKPFAKAHLFRDFLVGLDYFYFQKHQKQGGISDFEATEADRDIGQEIDVYFNWRILSDVSLSVEYGHFMPGKAYPASANDAEDYFSASLVYTF